MHQVHLVVLLGLSHNNGPWVSPVPIICMRVPDSCSICRACFKMIRYFVWHRGFTLGPVDPWLRFSMQQLLKLLRMWFSKTLTLIWTIWWTLPKFFHLSNLSRIALENHKIYILFYKLITCYSVRIPCFSCHWNVSTVIIKAKRWKQKILENCPYS